MKYYYDTSALCRHYHAEPGSDKVEALFEEDSARHVISRLTYVECHSAFALKVRTGQLTGDDFALLRRRLRADVHRRSLVVARTLRLHFDLAESLLVKYSLTQRLRTLDALHLAIALDLNAKGTIDTLVSADTVLVSLARSEGLPVINPLDPYASPIIASSVAMMRLMPIASPHFDAVAQAACVYGVHPETNRTGYAILEWSPRGIDAVCSAAELKAG